MKLLAESFKRRPFKADKETTFVSPHQLMGVEIETEANNALGVKWPASQELVLWSSKSDGSLSNGREFVLKAPLSGIALAGAINDFFSVAKLERASTSSTHIHINMMDDESTTATMQNMVMLAWILESAIFAMADPSREWCGYTNRLTTAPADLMRVMLDPDLENNDKQMLTVVSDLSRYYGLNTQALQKYGSIEFRYFPTATSKEELVDWINLVQSFKLAALDFSSIESLLKVFETEQSYTEFLGRYFTKWAADIYREIPWERAKELEAGALITYQAATGANVINFDQEKVAGKFKRVAGRKKVRNFKRKLVPLPQIMLWKQGQPPVPSADLPVGTLMIGSSHLFVNMDGWAGSRTWQYVHDITADTYHPDLFADDRLLVALGEAITEDLGSLNYRSSAIATVVRDYNLLQEYVENFANRSTRDNQYGFRYISCVPVTLRIDPEPEPPEDDYEGNRNWSGFDEDDDDDSDDEYEEVARPRQEFSWGVVQAVGPDSETFAGSYLVGDTETRGEF